MTLRAARIKGETLFCSFRDPVSEQVHGTLPLPPKTTLIGLLGAAMGIGFDNLTSLYDEVQTAVIGKHEGEVWDLKAIWKLEAPRKKEELRRIEVGRYEAYRSLIKRQHCFRSNFMIYYSSEDHAPEEIIKTFKDPRYALSLGMSNELLRIRDAGIVEMDEHNKGSFKNTVLPGEPESLNLKPVHEEGFEPPMTRELPVKFKVSWGRRIPAEKKTVTFLTRGEFEAEVPCHFDDEHEHFVAFY